MRGDNYICRRIDSSFRLPKGAVASRSLLPLWQTQGGHDGTKVSTETRQDLPQAVRERYRGSLKEEKLRILDEFVAVTGYHRKHIIRLFNAAPVAGRLGRRPRLPVYDEAVREALIVLWEASG